MSATSAFLTKWRGILSRQPVALVEIELDASTTLRIATRGSLFDGHWYDNVIIGEGAVSASEPILNSDVTLATMSLRIADTKVSLNGGKTISELLNSYDWQGARVTLRLADVNLPAVDAFTRFIGRIQSWTQNNSSLTVRCIQDSDWNRDIAPKRVTRAEYPQALEQTVGAPIGVAIGNLSGPPMRQPFSNQYGAEYRAKELLSGGQQAATAVVVDAGRSNQDVGRGKIIVSSRQSQQFGSMAATSTANNGTLPFLLSSDNTLHSIDPVQSDIFNTSDLGTGFYIAPDAYNVWCPITPVRHHNGNALNYNALLDSSNETSACVLTFNVANASAVEMRLPDIDDTIGISNPTNAKLIVIYRRPYIADNAYQLRFDFYRYLNDTDKFGATFVAPDVYGPQIQVFTGTLQAATLAPTEMWKYSQCSIAPYLYQIPNQPPAISGFAEIIAIGIAVPYRPNRAIYQTSRNIKRVAVKKSKRHILSRKWHQYTVYKDEEFVENVTEIRSRFFANIKGVADDALGTFTGTPNRLIERIPDVTKYVLNQIANVPLSSIQTSNGILGSFNDARASLVDSSGNALRAAMLLSEDLDVNSVLAWLASASASSIQYSEMDGMWRILPWQVNPPVTYHRKLNRLDILEPDAGVNVTMTPTSDVISSLRIAYGYDAASSGYKHECSASSSGSVAGHYFRNLRDGALAISQNVNDKLEVKFNNNLLGTKTFTINAGNHSTSTLLAALKGALSGINNSVAFGSHIVAGVNDVLAYEIVGVGSFSATLTAGQYATMHDLAAEAQRALNTNAANGVWVVQYNDATNAFTFSKSVVAGESSWRWDPAQGSVTINNALFTQDSSSVLLTSALPTTVKVGMLIEASQVPSGTSIISIAANRLSLIMSGSSLATTISPVSVTFSSVVPHALSSFGFDCSQTNKTAKTSIYACNMDRYSIAFADEFDILWRSGANGQLGTKQCAWEILGFDWSDDTRGIGFGQRRLMGWTPKENIETIYASADARFGKKRTMTIEGRVINDTFTARELRKRLTALQTKPRGVVTFSSESLCDMQRGDVFEFDADMDNLKPYSAYGSGGSWQSKKFRVIETTQKFGNSWHTEITAVDVTD